MKSVREARRLLLIIAVILLLVDAGAIAWLLSPRGRGTRAHEDELRSLETEYRENTQPSAQVMLFQSFTAAPFGCPGLPTRPAIPPRADRMLSELSMREFRSHFWNLTNGYGIREQRFVRSTQRHGGYRYSPTDYHAQPLCRRNGLPLESDFVESDLAG